MKLKEIFSEAKANVLSGTTHALRYMIALSAVLILCCFYDLVSVGSIVDEANGYVSSGSSTYIISDVGKISGKNCELLNGLNGVQAAGAVKAEKNKLSIVSLPSAPVPIYGVSKSAYKLFMDKKPQDKGVYISSTLANTLNLKVGSKISTAGHTADISGIYNWPDDGRRPGYDYAIISPEVTNAAYDECWVRSWPMLNKIGDVLKTTIIGADQADKLSKKDNNAAEDSNKQKDKDTSNIFQLNTTHGYEFTGADEFDSRTTQDIWTIALIIAFAIGFTSIIIRRIEFASALHAGMKKSQTLLQVLAESLAWIIPSIITTLPVAFYFAIFKSDGDILSIVDISFRIIVSGVFGAIAGVAFAMFTIREKNLFRYFKGR